MANGPTDVHITCNDRDALMTSINTFAAGRSDIALIGEGVTRIDRLPFVVVEFEDTPDEAFLRWLDEDGAIEEVSIYEIILADEAEEAA